MDCHCKVIVDKGLNVSWDGVAWTNDFNFDNLAKDGKGVWNDHYNRPLQEEVKSYHHQGLGTLKPFANKDP